MSLWEKNTYLLGLGSVIGGMAYFGLVALQSLQLGALAPPSLVVWLSYITIQIALSSGAVWLVSRHETRRDATLLRLSGLEDERDRIIRERSEASFGHFAGAFVMAAMALWFVHENTVLLFHSLVAAMLLAELLRCGYQLVQYNRAI